MGDVGGHGISLSLVYRQYRHYYRLLLSLRQAPFSRQQPVKQCTAPASPQPLRAVSTPACYRARLCDTASMTMYYYFELFT